MKNELTIEAFGAVLLSQLQGKPGPLWMCASTEVQEAMLKDFRDAYSQWAQSELDKEKLRADSPIAKMAPWLFN